MAEWGVPGMTVAARTRDACHANEVGTEHGCSSSAAPKLGRQGPGVAKCVKQLSHPPHEEAACCGARAAP